MKSVKFEIAAKTFAKIISGAKKTLSKDELRPSMRSVLLEIFDNKVRFISTNGSILLLQDVNTDTNNFAENFALNLLFFEKNEKTGLESIKIKANSNGNVLFSVTKNQCEVIFDATSYILDLNTEKFPDYKNALPFNSFYFIIETQKLQNAMNMALLYVNKNTKMAKFLIDKNKLVIIAEDENYGKSSQEDYDITVKSPSQGKFNFGMNASYMKLTTELLSDCKEVKITYSSNDGAFLSSCNSDVERSFLMIPFIVYSYADNTPENDEKRKVFEPYNRLNMESENKSAKAETEETEESKKAQNKLDIKALEKAKKQIDKEYKRVAKLYDSGEITWEEQKALWAKAKEKYLPKYLQKPTETVKEKSKGTIEDRLKALKVRLSQSPENEIIKNRVVALSNISKLKSK